MLIPFHPIAAGLERDDLAQQGIRVFLHAPLAFGGERILVFAADAYFVRDALGGFAYADMKKRIQPLTASSPSRGARSRFTPITLCRKPSRARGLRLRQSPLIFYRANSFLIHA
jgi:hypothetical protein